MFNIAEIAKLGLVTAWLLSVVTSGNVAVAKLLA